MFVLVLLTLLLCAAMVGWGHGTAGILHRFGGLRDARWTCPELALLGVFVVTVLALATNFLLPLSAWSGFVTLTIGVLACAVRWVGRRRLDAEERISVLIVFVCAAYFAARLIKYRLQYDAGLYHIPSLIWMEQSAVPFGLANLENRLGFDSTWLIFHAVLRLPRVQWASLKVVECFVWVLAAWTLLEGLRLRWRVLSARNQAVVLATALPSLAYFFTLGPSDISSTDNAPNLFALMTVVFFVEFLDARQTAHGAGIGRPLFLMIVSGCLAITGKLSLIPLSLLMTVAVFLAVPAKQARGSLLAGSIVGLAFTGAWMLRNFILTGCLAYPVAITCNDHLEWGLGGGNATMMKNLITAWARGSLTGGVAGAGEGGPWIDSWARETMRSKFALFLAVLLVAATVLLVRQLRKSAAAPGNWRLAIRSPATAAIMLTVFLGLILWFYAAPHYRFAWSFLLLSVMPAYAAWLMIIERARLLDGFRDLCEARLAPRIAVAVAALVIVATTAVYPSLTGRSATPVVPVREHRLGASGTIVRVPLNGDQCWAVPQPCTAYLASDLSVDSTNGRWIFLRATSP